MLTQQEKKVLIDYNNLRLKSFIQILSFEESETIENLHNQINLIGFRIGKCNICSYQFSISNRIITNIKTGNSNCFNEKLCVVKNLSLYNTIVKHCNSFKITKNFKLWENKIQEKQ